MHTFVLQDWTTIRGNGAGSGLIIVQGEQAWLDLTPYQDVFFWVDVREVTTGASGRVDLYFDTSPTEDETLFLSLTGQSTPAVQGLAANASPTIVKLPMLSATVPIARYLRWRLVNATATTAWDTTFRIVVAANSPGM